MAAAKVYDDPNFPVTEDGRVHHLNVKRGEVANRVLSVGSAGRAKRAAEMLTNVTEVSSSRGFHTYTGLYNGTPVSIIATGMGTPMMDFVVRETRAIVSGEMAIVRFGTCGGLGTSAAGALVLAKDSVFVRREPAAFHGGDCAPFSITQPLPGDADILSAYEAALKQRIKSVGGGEGKYPVVLGTDVTCDSFYSSQGRQVATFDDKNADLLQRVETEVPSAACAQMETFQLYDLALCAKPGIKAGGAAVAMSNRSASTTLDMSDFGALEMAGCAAALDALAAVELDAPMSGPECVWEQAA